MTAAEYKSDLKLITGTPYLTLIGKLWSVCFEDNLIKFFHFFKDIYKNYGF